MIAVDSSVLLDILIDDPAFADASGSSLEQAISVGDVVVCEAVVAEVQAMLDTRETAMDALAEFGIRYVPISENAAVRAGHMQRRFRDRGGRRQRVWPTSSSAPTPCCSARA